MLSRHETQTVHTCTFSVPTDRRGANAAKGNHRSQANRGRATLPQRELWFSLSDPIWLGQSHARDARPGHNGTSSEHGEDYEGQTRNREGCAKGEVLLALFERPPDAIGETINSAVVIASESAAAYPGLKKAEDYVSPLTELATAKGFKGEGDPDILNIDSRQLVRANFTKPLSDKLTMHQSTLILLAKGQIISFTFIGGSEEEVDNLIEGLHFDAAKPQR